MASIVQLSEMRDRNAARQGFAAWRRFFGRNFTIETRVTDLSDSILYSLSVPGEQSEMLLNSLIVGFLGFGEDALLNELPSSCQVKTLDIYFYLSDQIHFELMRRIGWIEDSTAGKYTICEGVRHFRQIRESGFSDSARLSCSHPEYDNYCKLIPRERQVFIRRLFPEALNVFKEYVTTL